MSTDDTHDWYMSWLDRMAREHINNPGILKKLNQLRTIEEQRHAKNTD